MAEEMKRVTLLKSGEATYVEKKSEFIGYARPVSSEEEAIEFVKSIKKKHSDRECFFFILQYIFYW